MGQAKQTHQFPRLHEDKFYGHLLLMGALRFTHPTQLVAADFGRTSVPACHHNVRRGRLTYLSLRPGLYTMLIPIRIQIKTFECSGIKPSEHSLGSIVD